MGPTREISPQQVSPLVGVLVAPNPGVMTGPGTNTYIVGRDPALLIDPAVGDRDFLEAVSTSAGRVAAILVTHRHSDHVGGARELAHRHGCHIHAFGPAPAGGVDVVPLADGDIVEIPGVRLIALHTPGHAVDHVCFYLESENALFSGDNVLGEGTAVIVPPEGSMRDYLRSLERMRAFEPDRIYPGHFRHLDNGTSVIDHYLSHRAERRRAVLEAVTAGAGEVGEIVAAVYRDTPSNLHPVAALQVEAMLQMLEEDGEVERLEQRWKRTGVD